MDTGDTALTQGAAGPSSTAPAAKYSRTQCLILYSFIFTAFGLAASIIGPTATALAEQLHCDETDLGPVYLIGGLVCLLGSFPAGWLVDRGPAHLVLGVCLLSEAIAFSLIPRCTSLTCLITVNSAASFTYNFLNTIVNTLTVWTDQANFSTWLNFVNTLFGVGSFLTPLVATAAHQYLGSFLRAYYVVAVCAAACGLACFLVTPPPPPPALPPAPPAASPKPDAPAPANGASHPAADDAPPPHVAPTVRASSAGGATDASRAAFWSMLCSMVLLLGLTVGSEVSYGAWIFTYASKYAGLGVITAEGVNSAYWAAFTVARLVATAAAAWLHPTTMLLLSFPLALLGTALPLLLPHAALTPTALFAAAILVGAGASTGYANTVSLFGRYARMQGWVMGMFSAASSTGCMVMPMLMAALAKRMSTAPKVPNYQSIMWVLAVSYGTQILLLGVCVLMGQRYRAAHGAPVDELTEPLLGGAEGVERGDEEAAVRA